MNEAIDYSTVKWVKQELDATLKQARQALEAHVDNPQDESQLRFCAVHLHQVHGTLTMVELYGAALLAEEMEQVVEALLAGNVSQKQEAYELIMRAILQLPDYLERLVSGGRDMPLVLLPLLNDLRAIRGQKLLSENALFSPDLSLPLPDAARVAHSGEDLTALARKQRHSYQLALLGWFRGKDVEANLERLGDALMQLQAACHLDVAQRLWWIAGGMVVALRAGWLDTSMATKLLLGQVDRQIKRILDEGENALATQPPADLLKNLLFYVARSRDGGEPVTLLKKTYRLGALLPDSAELEQAQGSLSGHNAELMRTVSMAIKEDLARVKDALDLFLRGGRKTTADLQPAADTLARVGDTLGMLGLGALRKQVQAQSQVAADIVAGRKTPEENVLMDIASALLYVESSLDGLVRGGAVEPEPAAEEPASGMSLPEAEFNQVRGVVADEAIRDISQAKDSILAFMENTSEFEVLDKVPQLFHQIKGGLLLLNELRAAELIDAVRDFVAERMLARREQPAESALDDLADAISSVEYYLESLREGRVFGNTVLDVAAKSIARLGYTASAQTEAAPAASVGDIMDAADDAPAAEIEEITFESIDLGASEAEAPSLDVDVFNTGDDGLQVESIEVGDLETVDLTGTADAFEFAVEDAFGAELDAFAMPGIEAETAPEHSEETIGVAPAVPASMPTPVAAPMLAALPEDIDSEILEIFIEESQEELANINDYLPRWLANEEDRDALVDMRRSFHTLKGSGRLVGALRIGEFAWAYESMLNRVIDGTLTSGETVCGLLEHAARALPELVAQIRDGSATTQPIEAMMNMAQAVCRGETVSLADLDAAPAAAQLSPAAAPAEDIAISDVSDFNLADVTDGPDPFAAEAIEFVEHVGIDPVLYEIFSNEARDHLTTIREFLEACAQAGRNCRVSDELLRALHTLHGSASMAGAEAIAQVSYEVEQYAKALRNDQLPLSCEGMALTEQAMQTIETLLREMLEPAGVQTPYADIIAAIEALPRSAGSSSEAPSAPVADDTARFEIKELAPSAGAEADPFADLALDMEDAFAEAAAVETNCQALTQEDVAATALENEVDFGAAETISTVPAAAADLPDEPVAEVFAEVPAPHASGDSGDAWVNFDYADVDADLLDVFLEEGDEILGAIDTTLQNWMAAPDDNALMAELQRHLHTLKGGARMANIAAIGDLSHALESLLIAVVDGQVTPSQGLFDALLVAQDRVVHMLEAVRGQRPMRSAGVLIEQLEALRRGETPAAAPLPVPAEAAAARPAALQTAIEAAADEATGEVKLVARTQQELVRVRADLLDNMVNFAGEISIYRSRLEQQVGSMRFNLGEFGQTVDRLREQLRKLEIETEAQVLFRYERDGGSADSDFDPLEMDRYSHLQQLSRSMLEGIGDLVSIQGLLDNITRESETLLIQQARVNTELQEGLMRTRMVPFSGLAPRMRRIVRQACQELGKRAELTLEGAEGEMDRTVIDRIIAPIEHMLRNAIAHGIEMPDKRAASGKRETGTIKVSLSRDGSEVVIRMSDDGAGMNLEAIRRKARERGLITDDVELSDNDVMQFVLETGFSTAEKVSQISGRGVGMDVVNSEVKQLGGSLHIDSVAGRGTTFTIRLPFTLAISQALLVQVHDEIYAIPLTGIEGIVRMGQDDLSRHINDASTRFDYAGHSYPVQSLGALLGHGATVLGPGAPKRLPLLLVRSGDHRMALQVEALLGSRETVVKSVGPQISTVRGISGATILGDGRVVLILDLGGLLRAGGVGFSTEQIVPAARKAEARALTVMVVDDSITVRKVTTRLLERNEMRVITAKDGVDAVAKLQEHIPDVMLLDIEMPRMDGFELATHVRNEPRLRAIPMIMITSRTGDKHRKRAMEIGVNRYLGKPYQESELLDTIRNLAGEQKFDG
jgi:chemosensory pili system protein ChpA (sensor histidine kinase/response regulator)